MCGVRGCAERRERERRDRRGVIESRGLNYELFALDRVQAKALHQEQLAGTVGAVGVVDRTTA